MAEQEELSLQIARVAGEWVAARGGARADGPLDFAIGHVAGVLAMLIVLRQQSVPGVDLTGIVVDSLRARIGEPHDSDLKAVLAAMM